DDGGTLTTRPLTFAGDRLVINARAPKSRFDAKSPPSAPHGTIRVEVLDALGHAQAGHGAADCDAFSGDEGGHVVTGKGDTWLGRLGGGPMRLRFHLRRAALYSFRCGGEGARPSGVNRLCPGCRGRA